MQDSINRTGHWDLDTIPYADIDLGKVQQREDLFYLVTAASFVEIAADLYADNLVHYFDDNTEAVDWLENHWKPEEMRHGQVLRDYAAHAWPQFDWKSAYAAFFADYSRRCTMEGLESTHCLEMAARCVVETGTSTFYESLAQQTDEPVLIGIAHLIRADEINHYKHFYHYFRQYHDTHPASRLKIFGALRRRLLEARNSDAQTALWHVYRAYHPDMAISIDDAGFKALGGQLSQQVRRYYPISMAAKMLLRPLDLPPVVSHVLEGPVARATAWVLL